MSSCALSAPLCWSATAIDSLAFAAQLGCGLGEPGSGEADAERDRGIPTGLATNLANPEGTLVFFEALLASLLPPSPDAALRVEVMASMLALAGAWFALTALAAGSAVVVRASDRARTGIDRFLGPSLSASGPLLLGHS